MKLISLAIFFIAVAPKFQLHSHENAISRGVARAEWLVGHSPGIYGPLVNAIETFL